MRAMVVVGTCLGGLGWVGCSVDPVNIGDDTGGSNTGGSGYATNVGGGAIDRSACSTGSSGGQPTSDTGGRGGAAPSVTHVWVGYAEQHKFPSGSDQVVIRLTDDGGGTFEVGNAPPLPPATDPEVGYPAWVDVRTGYPDSEPYEGFVYALQNASLTSIRLVFSVNPNQVWAGWCAMQTPAFVPLGPGAYDCLPYGAGGYDQTGCYFGTPTDRQPVDCGKLALCGQIAQQHVCACDACACRSADGGWTVDLVRNGDRLDGTLQSPAGYTIHLAEQPAS